MSAISLCSAVAEEGNAVPFPEIALQGSWKKRKEARKKTGLFPSKHSVRLLLLGDRGSRQAGCPRSPSIVRTAWRFLWLQVVLEREKCFGKAPEAGSAAPSKGFRTQTERQKGQIKQGPAQEDNPFCAGPLQAVEIPMTLLPRGRARQRPRHAASQELISMALMDSIRERI